MSESDDVERAETKVERVIRKYELDGLGDELERRWLDDGEGAASTRELADLFNRRVLSAAVEESDVFTLSRDVERAYRTLTDESAADGTLVRSRLETSGIDVDELTADFVSHQTVYRYLTDHRGVEHSTPDDVERRETAVEKLKRLRGRTTAVTERTLETMRTGDLVDIDGFSVLTDIQVLCEDCGRSHDAVDLLEQGACDCRSG